MTVACVWVHGNVPYEAEYVTRLQGMVKRWMDRPFQFVCLTDRPEVLKRVETVRVPSPGKIAGWWSKLALFAEQTGFTGRVLYLDLDTLVMQSLAPIVDFPAPFALIPDAGHFVPRNGRLCVKRFNSSVMVWDAGCNQTLFDSWTPDVAKRLHGDQDWLGEQVPETAMFPLAWFPRLSELEGQPPGDLAKVVLAKVPKPHIAVKHMRWVREVWQ